MRMDEQTSTRTRRTIRFLNRVGHISELAIELVEVQLRREYDRIAEVSALAACIHASPLPLLGVGENSGVEFARVRALCACQSRHVNDHIGFEVFARVGNAVAQDETSFGICVGDFNSFSRIQLDDIIGSEKKFNV